MKENEIKNNENNDIEIKNDDLTNASFLKEPLSDEELDSISGGFGGSGPINGVIAIRKDSKGNNTHWQITRYKKAVPGAVFHFRCPKCGGLLHTGFLGRLYCDPCDESWITVSKTEGFYPGCE